MVRTPWSWYSWWINEKGSAWYMKFHADLRYKRYCQENGIKPYRQNAFKMLRQELKVRREWREAQVPGESFADRMARQSIVAWEAKHKHT